MKRIAAITITLALVAAACGSATDATADTAAEAPLGTTTLATTTTTHPPTTTSNSPATTTTMTDATTEADREAISHAYEIVFSSETSYEDKVPYLEDPDGLEETVLEYQKAGESMGGVSLAATKITVDEAVAEVIYDFLFAGTPTYPNLTGDAVLVDGTWMITRVMFCSIMTSARVGCPAP
jgi:hypothetical protein